MTEYLMPKTLSPFQEAMYKHLIDWKWKNITRKAGEYAGHEYDAVLPESYKDKLPHLYEPIRQLFLGHQKRFHFKTHKFADHMASSQIACANLFLPIMAHPDVAPQILASVKPDLASIATEELDNGFRIEFWDEPTNMLGDHNKSTGTDADFAVAYRNQAGQLCLWLIEHKLTEAEFTTCGGARSKGRKHGHYSCDSTVEILKNPDLCYYHGKCQYKYWPITHANKATFPRDSLLSHACCPFKEGMNQLWRNTALALAIETAKEGPYAKYKKVYFSVCHHPKNTALNESMDAFRSLLGEKDRFSSFTSDLLIDSARKCKNPALKQWANWYSELYLS